jgi:F-type H+-transporting ATPase subunit b
MIFAATEQVDLPLWNAIASAIFFVILAYVAGPPLVKALRRREQSTVELLSRSDVARQALESLRDKNAVELARVQREAEKMLAEGRRDAAALRQDLLEQARQEIGRIQARTNRDIALAENAARVELYRTAADLSFGVAERLLRAELRADDHRRLVDQSINSLERNLVGGAV